MRVVGPRAVRLYPIFHPAAALYTPANVEVLRADFLRLPELLALDPPPQPEPERPAEPEPEPEPELARPPEAEPAPPVVTAGPEGYNLNRPSPSGTDRQHDHQQ